MNPYNYQTPEALVKPQTAHTFDIEALGSVAALQAMFDREKRDPHAFSMDRYFTENRDRAWFGCQTIEELAGIVDHGDRATTSRVQQSISSKSIANVPSAHAIRPVLKRRRVMGQVFDLERVLDGDPLPWSRWESRKTSGQRIVSLYLPLGGNSHLTASEIGWGPVAAIVIADVLEQAGYRVEMWGASSVVQNPDYRTSRLERNSEENACVSRFLVKNADQPIDLNGIARIAHPTMLRGVMFSINTSVAFDAGWTVGQTKSDCSNRRVKLGTAFDPDAINVATVHSERECLAEIERVLKTFT